MGICVALLHFGSAFVTGWFLGNLLRGLVRLVRYQRAQGDRELAFLLAHGGRQ